MTAPAGDARIWMGQVAEGRQTFSKPVKSWKELKFTNLVRQQTDFSCGAAALATLFNYAYGRETTEQQSLVNRSEERRVGKECVSKCRSRCAPGHKQKKKQQQII